MKSSENVSPPGWYIGHVKNGVVVLDAQVSLSEGQAVRVEPLGKEGESQLDQERTERLRQLQQLFAEWTQEDGALSDEEANRLHAALEQNCGVSFRSPKLD